MAGTPRATTASTTVNLGTFSNQENTDIANAPTGIIADIVAVARSVAKSKNFSPAQTQELEKTAVATSSQETGGTFNPNAVGDNGTSFGLFQLHEGGELDNLPGTQAQQIQEAYNPVTNASQAIPGIADAIAGGQSNLGAAAATAQRPANPTAYAEGVNANLFQSGGVGVGTALYDATKGEPSVSVKVPNNVTATNLAGGTASSTGTSTSTTGSGLLAKIGGYLLALLLIGVGISVLFKGNGGTPVATAAKAAVAV